MAELERHNHLHKDFSSHLKTEGFKFSPAHSYIERRLKTLMGAERYNAYLDTGDDLRSCRRIRARCSRANSEHRVIWARSRGHRHVSPRRLRAYTRRAAERPVGARLGGVLTSAAIVS